VETKLTTEIEKQLSQIKDKLTVNRDEKKQMLRLQKALNTSLRMMDLGGEPKRKSVKVRRRKHTAAAPSAS
jgi:hypothetical protein